VHAKNLKKNPFQKGKAKHVKDALYSSDYKMRILTKRKSAGLNAHK